MVWHHLWLGEYGVLLLENWLETLELYKSYLTLLIAKFLAEAIDAITRHGTYWPARVPVLAREGRTPSHWFLCGTHNSFWVAITSGIRMCFFNFSILIEMKNLIIIRFLLIVGNNGKTNQHRQATAVQHWLTRSNFL